MLIFILFQVTTVPVEVNNAFSEYSVSCGIPKAPRLYKLLGILIINFEKIV